MASFCVGLIDLKWRQIVSWHFVEKNPTAKFVKILVTININPVKLTYMKMTASPKTICLDSVNKCVECKTVRFFFRFLLLYR